MSVVVGVVHNGEVWIGADSLVSGEELGCVRTNRKIARHGEILFGSAGPGRVLQIVEHCVEFPHLAPREDALSFLIRSWIPAVQQGLRDYGHMGQDEGIDQIRATFVVALRGRLFFIGGNFAVDEHCDFIATGSGEDFAFGALHVLRDNEPEQRVALALEASARFCNSVSGPFHIEKL